MIFKVGFCSFLLGKIITDSPKLLNLNQYVIWWNSLINLDIFFRKLWGWEHPRIRMHLLARTGLIHISSGQPSCLPNFFTSGVDYFCDSPYLSYTPHWLLMGFIQTSQLMGLRPCRPIKESMNFRCISQAHWVVLHWLDYCGAELWLKCIIH